MTKYLPPHYYKLEVPRYTDGNQIGQIWTSTRSRTPQPQIADYVYNPDSNMLLYARSFSSFSDNFNSKFHIIKKSDLKSLLTSAAYHTNQFSTAENRASDPTSPLSSNNNLSSIDNLESNPEYFTAERGDTLSKIAKRYNTTVDAIVEANKDKPSDPGFKQITNKDLIYAGANYYLPSGSYIKSDESNNPSQHNSSTSKSDLQVSDTDYDFLKFFMTPEEIATFERSDKKHSDTDSSTNDKVEQHNDVTQSDNKYQPDLSKKNDFCFFVAPIFQSVITSLTNIDQNIPSDSIIINPDDLTNILFNLYNHKYDLDFFTLPEDVSLNTLSSCFNVPIQSLINVNEDNSLLSQTSFSSDDIVLPKDTQITLPIDYTINDVIESLVDKSDQLSSSSPYELLEPLTHNYESRIYSTTIQPYALSSSWQNTFESPTVDENFLKSNFSLSDFDLATIYDYILDDPNISISSTYDKLPPSDKLFNTTHISSTNASSYGSANLDIYFISSPFLKKHMQPKRYASLMSFINTILVPSYQYHTPITFTPSNRNIDDLYDILVYDLQTKETKPLPDIISSEDLDQYFNPNVILQQATGQWPSFDE